MTPSNLKRLLGRASMLMAFCALLCACDPAGQPAGSSSHTAASALISSSGHAAAPVTSTAIAPLDSLLKKGMAYADLRTVVLEHGWQPFPDAMCKANVVGADYKRQCAGSPGLCKPCEEMPELSECSGDAVCVMRFRHTATGQTELLEVTTYGDISQWNVHGPDSQLGITGWVLKTSR